MTADTTLTDAGIDDAITTACNLIAPAWPLDQLVAVNPFWQMIDLPVSEVSSLIAARGGARAVADRAYFAAQWQHGRIQPADLHAAVREAGRTASVDALVRHLETTPAKARLRLVTDQLDADRDLTHCTAWREEVTHQISQLCAAEFDRGQGDWPAAQDVSLYPAWQYNVSRDRGIAILMGEPGLQKRFRTLPGDPDTLIRETLRTLAVPPAQLVGYLHALLLSINGWASWCAYLAWQAQLAGTSDLTLRELLAMRLAWDRVLFEHVASPGQRDAWLAALAHSDELVTAHRRDQQLDWIWQRAFETGYERRLMQQLARAPGTGTPGAERPALQAAFCLDVRSEVLRRHLEHAGGDSVQTRGFAGFFGAPIAYRPLGLAESQPRLPGLLGPRFEAVETSADEHAGRGDLSRRARLRLAGSELARRFRWGATSTFSYVEASGLLYAGKLFIDGFLKPHADHPAHGLSDAERTGLRLQLTANGKPLANADRIELAASILTGLSLTENLAPTVALIGHTAATRNNPQASALHCGACCGRSGEVNARLVANLLNESEVRAGLGRRGIHVPDDTRFVAGLHITTNDTVELFEDAADPRPTASEWLQGLFRQAGARTAAERHPALEANRAQGTASAPARALARRGRDWSQVRPEWGLAGNASMILAPRARTRGLDLGGRVFLHDYDADADADASLLSALLTAPTLVAHWINLQYYASTVDNGFYGSGNKILHNVAGGHIAVLEGNGGDIRIGLSQQSLHDGERWVHEPLRMSVFVQAPTAAIDSVIAHQDTVRKLVVNHWLFLYAIGDPGEPIRRRHADGWQDVDSEDTADAA